MHTFNILFKCDMLYMHDNIQVSFKNVHFGYNEGLGEIYFHVTSDKKVTQGKKTWQLRIIKCRSQGSYAITWCESL